MKNKKNENIKETEKKNLKWYEIVFILVVLIILALICFNTFRKKVDYHCKKAVCNSDNTICFTYDINENGETIKTWQGSCVKK